MKKPFFLLTFLALALSSAFAQSGTAQFADGEWTLERLSDSSGVLDLTLMKAGVAPTLTLLGTGGSTAQGTQVSGFAGCNTYRGFGVFTPRTVRFGALTSTEKACPPEVSQLEGRFLNLMSKVRGLSIRLVEVGKPGKSRLVLSTGSSRLSFSKTTPQMTVLPATPEPTLNTNSRLIAQWSRVGQYVGELRPTVTFTADGKVSGFAGCNRFMGTYTLEGDTLKFGALGSTRMACLSPEAQAQETVFLAQLQSQPKFEAVGSTLKLVLLDGTRVEFQRPVN